MQGYNASSPPGADIYVFLGVEHGSQGSNCWHCAHPDVDGDGLLDGEEDADHDGEVDAGLETNPLDKDTDDDGLWDGPLVRNNAGNITVWSQSHASGQNISDVTLSGVAAVYFDEPVWWADEGSVSYNLTNLTARQYLVTANLTEAGAASNVTRLLHVRLNGTTWGETRVFLNSTAPNWTAVTLGHILRPDGAVWNLSVTYDIAGFYLSNLTLTPVNLSEQWFGTNPLRDDTDRDNLSDGGEVGLNQTFATGAYSSADATDFTHDRPPAHQVA